MSKTLPWSGSELLPKTGSEKLLKGAALSHATDYYYNIKEEKKRRGFTLQRQCREKPSVIPGCPIYYIVELQIVFQMLRVKRKRAKFRLNSSLVLQIAAEWHVKPDRYEGQMQSQRLRMVSDSELRP